MKNPQSLLCLAMIAAGIAFVYWTNDQAHQYYYPGHEQVGVSASVLDFTAERDGRHEISHPTSLGNPEFTVIETESGQAISVTEFGWLTRLAHTTGHRGVTFDAVSGTRYQLSTEPWSDQGLISFGATDTRSVARWSIAGILLGGALIGLATLWLIVISIRRSKSDAAARETTEA